MTTRYFLRDRRTDPWREVDEGMWRAAELRHSCPGLPGQTVGFGQAGPGDIYWEGKIE